MTTQQIGYFLKLAEKLNYTSVANFFYITQPTLSRQIINLESELGFPLFVREKNGIRLTQEGRTLYEGLRPLDQDFRSLLQSVQKSYAQRYDVLSIGIMEEQLVSNSLLLALNLLRKECPHLDYQFSRRSHFQLWQGLMDGTYDLINIIYMPQDETMDHVSFLPLESEKTYVAIEKSLEPDYPDCINIAQLAELLNKYPLYLPYVESSSDFDPLEEFLKQLHLTEFSFKPDVRTGSDLLSVPMQVLARMGITVCNKSNLFSVDPDIRIMEVEGADEYQKGICYKTLSDNPNLTRVLSILGKTD